MKRKLALPLVIIPAGVLLLYFVSSMTSATGKSQIQNNARLQKLLAGSASPEKSASIKQWAAEGVEKDTFAIPAEQLDAIIKRGRTFIGTPHRDGGTQPGGFDCSGFLYYLFGQEGIALPRTAANLARRGRIISRRSALQRGDLVFFTATVAAGSAITHVGICTGPGHFLHVSSSRGVIVDRLTKHGYWHEHYLLGIRIQAE